MVRRYGDDTYLCLARNGLKIEEIDDVGAVKEHSEAEIGQNCELKHVIIIGVTLCVCMLTVTILHSHCCALRHSIAECVCLQPAMKNQQESL